MLFPLPRMHSNFSPPFAQPKSIGTSVSRKPSLTFSIRLIVSIVHCCTQIMLFCSTLFYCNTDKKKLINPQPGPLSVWSSHVLPTSAWVYSGSSGFLPGPGDVHVRWMGRSALSQPEWKWVWEWVSLGWKGIQASVFSCSPPCASGTNSDHLGPWSGMNRLENNYLIWFY